MRRDSKTVMNYKSSTLQISHDSALPDTLKQLFACFNMQNSGVRAQRSLPKSEHALVLQPQEVKSTLRKIYITKVAGPDRLSCGRLKSCVLFTSYSSSVAPYNRMWTPPILNPSPLYPCPRKLQLPVIMTYIIPHQGHHPHRSRQSPVCQSRKQIYVGCLGTRGRTRLYEVRLSTSSALILNTGVPQGYVLSLAFFTLTSKYSDTTIVGLIANNEETYYKE